MPVGWAELGAAAGFGANFDFRVGASGRSQAKTARHPGQLAEWRPAGLSRGLARGSQPRAPGVIAWSGAP